MKLFNSRFSVIVGVLMSLFVVSVAVSADTACQPTLIGASVYSNVDRSIPGNETATAITMTSEVFDTDNMWSSGWPARLTINTPGKYLITGQIRWYANSTGYRKAWIRVNGSPALAVETVGAVSTASVTTDHSLATVTYLAAGDYVELLVKQNSGSNVSVYAGTSYVSQLSAVKLD